MNKISTFFLFATIILLITSVVAQDKQDNGQLELSRDSLLTVARIIIDSAECRTLITVDENGMPQARTMSPFPPEDGMVIWLGTNPRSRKVKQINNNPNVIVFYYDTKGHSYVSIAGQARIVNDSKKRAHYWKKGWMRYYPDPANDYTLIEVTPKKLEICSFKHKLFWDSTGKPAFVEF
ncbi:MAG: pyridoxamine 5'-phosphate oxidase family protein [Bacteroidales bacterium]|jgi:general stress protein 26|nr:pyridoxamine 5'-phosphate oxidase family protein [Bacteroidales bacterium]